MSKSSGVSKLMAARAAAASAQKSTGGSPLNAAPGPDMAKTDDASLNEKRKDRSYNPIDEAERGSISSKLNEDAARYRKGPSPV